jgi:hypothetical protein
MLTPTVTERTHLSAHPSVPVVTCTGHVPTTAVPVVPKPRLS